MQADPIFGDKTWNDVRRIVFSVLKSRFPSASREDIEDAVGEAMVDLVDYWVTAPSSVSEDVQRNFQYACRRAKWMGTAFLVRILQERNRTVSLDHDLFDGNGEPLPLRLFVETEAGPEELTADADELARAREVIANLPDDELREWFAALVRGESVREASRRLGVPRSTISYRWRACARRVLPLAEHYGLRGVTR